MIRDGMLQAKLIIIEKTLENISGKPYHGCPSSIENLLDNYVTKGKQEDFLDDLLEIINQYKI